jgi:hypothetical protein
MRPETVNLFGWLITPDRPTVFAAQPGSSLRDTPLVFIEPPHRVNSHRQHFPVGYGIANKADAARPFADTDNATGPDGTALNVAL